MTKVFVVLDEEEQLLLENISMDEDSEEALKFVLEHIIPKVKKQASCLSGRL